MKSRESEKRLSSIGQVQEFWAKAAHGVRVPMVMRKWFFC